MDEEKRNGVQNPTEKPIPRFKPDDPEMLIGMEMGRARISCKMSGYNVVEGKSDGKYLTLNNWGKKGPCIIVETENNIIMSIQEKIDAISKRNRSSISTNRNDRRGKSKEDSDAPKIQDI